MKLKRMPWDEKAWRAFQRAFSPMPPDFRIGAMQKVAENVEQVARKRNSKVVELEDVYNGSKDILAAKAEFMYNSLVEALKIEGYIVDES